MNTSFRKSFTRDLKRIKDQSILDRVAQAIREVEGADTLEEISNLKKLTGFGDYYRIRIGEYRIGLAVDDDQIEFVRCLPRRDLYRFFP